MPVYLSLWATGDSSYEQQVRRSRRFPRGALTTWSGLLDRGLLKAPN